MPINISTRTPTQLKRAIHEKKNNSPAGTNKITQSTVAQPIKKKLCIHAPMRYPNIHHDD